VIVEAIGRLRYAELTKRVMTAAAFLRNGELSRSG
jgi:hypothetical protein